MRRWTGWLVALVLVTTGIGAAASAQVVDGADRRGDVVTYVGGRPTGPLPTRLDGDLIGYRYRYDSGRFTAVLAFRDLRRNVPRRYVGVLLTWTGRDQNDFTELEAHASSSRPRGWASLNGERCPVRHRIDYRRNRVTMSFPTRCIGSPRVVRANATSSVSDRRIDGSYYYIDRFPRLGRFEGENGVRVRRG